MRGREADSSYIVHLLDVGRVGRLVALVWIHGGRYRCFWATVVVKQSVSIKAGKGARLKSPIEGGLAGR